MFSISRICLIPRHTYSVTACVVSCDGSRLCSAGCALPAIIRVSARGIWSSQPATPGQWLKFCSSLYIKKEQRKKLDVYDIVKQDQEVGNAAKQEQSWYDKPEPSVCAKVNIEFLKSYLLGQTSKWNQVINFNLLTCWNEFKHSDFFALCEFCIASKQCHPRDRWSVSPSKSQVLKLIEM